MIRTVPLVALAGTLVLGGCDSLGQAMSSHTGVVARAAGHELTIDEAVLLLAPYPNIPAQTEVVDAIANLWVDYVLLATAAAQDTTLASLDLEPLLRPFMEQEVVYKLREDVITVDTALSDDELRTQYERDQPGAEIRARHILLRVPPEATQPQRDSVVQKARDIRAEAAGGADFAELARTHSQDVGSAQRGGDLDYFSRGQMIAPFEEAAFQLQPGEVSDIVESPYGLHIIKLEDRRAQPFADVRDMYRQSLIQSRIEDAEETYLRALTEPRRIEVQQGALEVAKELARKPFTPLGGRAGNRTLVRYQGGGYTAAEFRSVMRAWQPQQRARLSSASEDQIEQVLIGLARNKILVEEAERRGFSLSAAEQDSLRHEARQQLWQATRMTGLAPIEPQAGETQAQAIERRVTEFLQSILNGEQSVLPLGPLTFTLREQFGGEVYDRAFPAVVARVEADRPAMPEFGFPQDSPQHEEDMLPPDRE